MSIRILAALLALVAASRASAVPTLQVEATDLGSGSWQYDLTLLDAGGSEPLSGLNLLAAYTLFGLDDDSIVSAPAGWSYFAPLPPTVDELNYFSLSGASDIPVNGSLGGFSFESDTDPGTLDWSSVEADAIGGTSSTQVPLVTVFLPEPATGLLFAAGLAAQAACRRGASR